MLSLKHEGCGGFYHHRYSKGIYGLATYICEKCEDEVDVEAYDEEAIKRQEDKFAKMRSESKARMEEWYEENKADIQRKEERAHKATIIQALCLSAYEGWSESAYAASFISPDEGHIESFWEALNNKRVYEDYEFEFLENFKKYLGRLAESE